MLSHHERLSKESVWRRCKVSELHVEPLDLTSALYGNLSEFVAGTSNEAVSDTAENLGLALRVGGDLYPIRMTAYKTLLDRAKISGTALPKLKRKELADVLNACLAVHSSEALLLVRDEKVSATHSGDAKDYSVLPIDELLHTLEKNKLVTSYLQAAPGGRERKYYRLTDLGREQLDYKEKGWKLFSEKVNAVLGCAGC